MGALGVLVLNQVAGTVVDEKTVAAVTNIAKKGIKKSAHAIAQETFNQFMKKTSPDLLQQYHNKTETSSSAITVTSNSAIA